MGTREGDSVNARGDGFGGWLWRSLQLAAIGRGTTRARTDSRLPIATCGPSHCHRQHLINFLSSEQSARVAVATLLCTNDFSERKIFPSLSIMVTELMGIYLKTKAPAPIFRTLIEGRCGNDFLIIIGRPRKQFLLQSVELMGFCFISSLHQIDVKFRFSNEIQSRKKL